MSAAPDPPRNARLLVPKLSLSSCVRAFVTRNTVVEPLVDAAARLNRFPATPMCVLVWYMAGEAEMVEPPRGSVPPWSQVLLMGPQTRPCVTYNPGPVHIFMAVLYPQALHALCGVDLARLVDRWMPLEQVLDARWAALSDAVLAAPDDEARQQIVEAFLDPLWQAARGNDAGSGAADWVRHLALRAATGLGSGVRNIERRIKAWAGQPMRRLRRMQRAEQSFFDARNEYMDGKVCWSDVATRGGYTDQAHLCRETREITGLSPAELAKASRDEESMWIYRVWR
ncbi:AraC family transcriptional regulator [Oxalobacteraceae bacterium]|nr:AraC family transcriptional regulator [Oxalobacteraceae bacterium]